MKEGVGLRDLLLKNAYHPQGLTDEERAEARQLIEEAPFSNGDLCWACELGSKRLAIDGHGLCREHALGFLGDEMLRPMLLLVQRCVHVV